MPLNCHQTAGIKDRRGRGLSGTHGTCPTSALSVIYHPVSGEIPRVPQYQPCLQTLWSPVHAGRGSPPCCGLQHLPPYTVSHRTSSWLHTSRHSCLAKVGLWWHSRSPEQGEVESQARCQEQVGVRGDCITVTPVSREMVQLPTKPGNPFCE